MKVTEGSVDISVPDEKKISKKLPVFYNPVMKLNRDLSILLLQALGRTGLEVALPLSGTGVRGVRMLRELPDGMISQVFFNDANPNAIRAIEKNLVGNKIGDGRYTVSKNDANRFLQEGRFDYIDLDPFGSPNPFLDTAIQRLRRNGILAVTATDTSALAGTYLGACRRKYWAEPLRNELKHEIGLRIFIRKIQLVGAQHEIALTPLLSYSKDHYVRVMFQSKQSKTTADKLLGQHKFFHYFDDLRMEVSKQSVSDEAQVAGPVWIGALHDAVLLEKMISLSDEYAGLLRVLKGEADHPTVGFVDLHKVAKVYKINPPKTDVLVKRLEENGWFAIPTQFSPTGIRTNATIKEIKKILS